MIHASFILLSITSTTSPLLVNVSSQPARVPLVPGLAATLSVLVTSQPGLPELAASLSPGTRSGLPRDFDLGSQECRVCLLLGAPRISGIGTIGSVGRVMYGLE